jgi:hypothetical protein
MVLPLMTYLRDQSLTLCLSPASAYRPDDREPLDFFPNSIITSSRRV